AVLLSGCEKLEGQLNVASDIKLKSSKGEVRTIRVGTYSADISANTSKKITLRLNNDSDEKYVFNVPDGSLPTNGTFSYKANTVGQPVDLVGVVATRSTDSGRRSAFEQCQYQTPVQVCFPNPNGSVTCTVQYRTVYGQRQTEYFDRSTTKDLSLVIAVAGTTTEAAQFQGTASWVERVVTYQGQCR
ncbi:MAG: hypothetical protein K2Q18_05580, partial [Bdellovibrionales bacterium]|nr:hypothetical protein [Bdellovibrionales bacterium]